MWADNFDQLKEQMSAPLYCQLSELLVLRCCSSSTIIYLPPEENPAPRVPKRFNHQEIVLYPSPILLLKGVGTGCLYLAIFGKLWASAVGCKQDAQSWSSVICKLILLKFIAQHSRAAWIVCCWETLAVSWLIPARVSSVSWCRVLTCPSLKPFRTLFGTPGSGETLGLYFVDLLWRLQLRFRILILSVCTL